MSSAFSFSFSKSRLIGAASGWGAQLQGTEQGPEVLWNQDLPHVLKAHGIKSKWEGLLYPSQRRHEVSLKGRETLPLIIEHGKKLAACIQKALKEGDFPCVVGGDHAIAMGTWSGITSALNLQGNFGLIWIDAHMDAHTPLTSPSHAYHGMPVAALMGYGEPGLTHLITPGAKINPRDLAFIGVRSFEKEEAQLLEGLGVKIFSAAQVRQYGMECILEKAIVHVTRHSAGFGVSIDLDAFDPQDAPAVGSPSPNGIRVPTSLDAFRQLQGHENFCCLEIVEFNPERDQSNKTQTLIIDLLIRILPR